MHSIEIQALSCRFLNLTGQGEVTFPQLSAMHMYRAVSCQVPGIDLCRGVNTGSGNSQAALTCKKGSKDQ